MKVIVQRICFLPTKISSFLPSSQFLFRVNCAKAPTGEKREAFVLMHLPSLEGVEERGGGYAYTTGFSTSRAPVKRIILGMACR